MRLTNILYQSLFLILLITARVNAAVLEDLTVIEEETDSPEKISASKIQKSFDKASSKDNVLIFKYDQEETYKINLRTSISTVINLPEGEKITFFTLGDKKTFSANFNKQLPNILSLKTLFSGFDTNLIIKTDLGSVYNFYLRSFDEDSDVLPHFTVYVIKNSNQEQVINEKELLKTLKSNNDYIKKIPSLEKLNTQYKIKGDKEIAPIFVYDDGKWTYFDFGKNFVSDRLPTAYKVIDKFDSVLNTRTEGNLIIAQSLGVEGWTLKNGDKQVCIYPKVSLTKIYKDERFNQSSH